MSKPLPKAINEQPARTDEEIRRSLDERHGQVWTTAQLQEQFIIVGFSMGLVVVRRKSDGTTGSLDFTHIPRFYHSFVEDN